MAPRCARAIVIAAGVRDRRSPLSSLSRFEGVGVYGSATSVESQLCQGSEVVVVGGGNSAGQAAVFLSGVVRQVHVFVRSAGLASTMSRYLIRRIEETPTITVHANTEITQLEGAERLERIRWRNNQTGDGAERAVQHLFVTTGAEPNTAWLNECVALDPNGFVKTGAELGREELSAARWPLGRAPHLLVTSLPAVFAVGAVRSGSVKRVASAVGEGSICIQLVHKTSQE